MFQKFYSPGILSVASSLVGEDSLSHHVDPAIGACVCVSLREHICILKIKYGKVKLGFCAGKLKILHSLSKTVIVQTMCILNYGTHACKYSTSSLTT